MVVKRNPVRDLSSVERDDTAKFAHSAGMQRISYHLVAFLRNAVMLWNAIFLPNFYPYRDIHHQMKNRGFKKLNPI